MGESILALRNIVWTLLPFFFAWIVQQLKKSKINMDRIEFIVKKIDEIVEWIEEEYPEIPYIDKINKVIDILIDELEKAGYEIGSRKSLERMVRAGFHRYRQNKLMLNKFLNNN